MYCRSYYFFKLKFHIFFSILATYFRPRIGYEYLTFEPALERSSEVHYTHDQDELLSSFSHVEDELKLLIEHMNRQDKLISSLGSG